MSKEPDDEDLVMITSEVDGKLNQWRHDVGAWVVQGEVVAVIDHDGSLQAVHAPAADV